MLYFLTRGTAMGEFLRLFGLSPRLVLEHFAIWQLVTYMFLHDPFGFGHILFNMLTLWMFGADLERTWGTRALPEVLLPVRHRRRHSASWSPTCLFFEQLEHPDHRRIRRDLRLAAGFRDAVPGSRDPVQLPVPDQGEVLRHDHRRHRLPELRSAAAAAESATSPTSAAWLFGYCLPEASSALASPYADRSGDSPRGTKMENPARQE